MKDKASAPHRRQFLLLGAAALALTGCGNLLGPPGAAQIYVLNPPTAAVPPGAKVAWALAIELPDASDSLDTDRIALTHSDTTLDYYANATWPDHLPDLVQTALLAGFEKSGRIDSVAREQDALHADYSLTSDIRDFAAHYSQSDGGEPSGTPDVKVTIVAHMAEARSRKIVASLTVDRSVTASANSVDAVVMAFDTALAQAVTQIAAWALALPPPAPAATQEEPPPEARRHAAPMPARGVPPLAAQAVPGQPPPGGP